jgi:hypothetical protein
MRHMYTLWPANAPSFASSHFALERSLIVEGLTSIASWLKYWLMLKAGVVFLHVPVMYVTLVAGSDGGAGAGGALLVAFVHVGYPDQFGRQLPHALLLSNPAGHASHVDPFHALRHRQTQPVVTVPVTARVVVLLHTALMLHVLE